MTRHAAAWYLTDYAATPATPLSWRYDREQAGGGAIVDVGAHVLSVLEHVTGPVRRVVAADSRILIPERPVPAGAVVGHGQVQGTGAIMLACDAAQQAAAEGRPVDIAALDARHRGNSAGPEQTAS